MAQQRWAGRVAVDIRDSEPTGRRSCSPGAPDGAPNVLMIVWDDVGDGAMDVDRVVIDVSGDRYVDHEREALAFIARD